MLKKELYIALFLILVNTIVFGQDKKLERANQLYEDKSYAHAIPEYESVLEKEVLPEAMLKLALSYWKIRKAEKAEQWFEIASINGGFNRVNEYFSEEYIYTYAEVLKFNGKYKEAKERFLEYEAISGNSKGGLQAKIATIIPILMRDSSKVQVNSFEYNTAMAEFAPQLKDETLYYVGASGKSANRSDLDMYTGEPYLDILMSKYPGTDSSEAPKALGKRINSNLHEGPFTFSRSGEKIIFTRNYYSKGKEQRREDGFLGFGLFESLKTEAGKWENPQKLEMGEIAHNYSHPSLSYNGELLYFVSDMPGGYGGTDIYVSTRLSDGWSTPRNLGPAVNTQGNEAYPYIHLTGTLYFASDYHQGLGGLDIFSARKDELGEWGNIRNLGYPINSSADDFGLILKPDSRSGYFSSNRPGGKGSDDIYSALIDAPVDELLDIDSLIAVMDSVDSDSLAESEQQTNEPIVKSNIEDTILQVEKDALRNSSGGYFEFTYGDDNSDMSVEEELRLLEKMELDNKAVVREYFGEDKQLRTEEELKNELEKYSAAEEEEDLTKEEVTESIEAQPEKPIEEKAKPSEPAVAKEPESLKEKSPKSTLDESLSWADFQDRNGDLIVNQKSREFINKSAEGLVFRIQIGAYRVPVFGGAEKFYNAKNIESYTLEDNITRYLLPQSFESIQAAEAYRKSLENERMKDAFIVPFLNAKRIGMNEALKILSKN